jgi:hypothetical protein
MTYMLIMAALEDGTPMPLVISVKASYLPLHRRMMRDAGRHQRKIVSAISQQTPDAMTNGTK